MRPRVSLLTGVGVPADPETTLLVTALARRGIDAPVVAWSDATAMADPGDLVIIRTTWDYTHTPTAFVEALRRCPAPLWNPVDVVADNIHKRYLLELAAAGVPVVPTRLLVPGDDLTGVTGRIVLKPEVSAGADGIGLFDAADPAAAAHLATLLDRGAVLLQPYMPQVQTGERSLIFLGGTFSHAVHKVPAAGDFRVQEHHGGRSQPCVPTADELRVADLALATVGTELLYARVDLLVTAEGPLVMELELIEPSLFLEQDEHAPDRLAAAIVAALR